MAEKFLTSQRSLPSNSAFHMPPTVFFVFLQKEQCGSQSERQVAALSNNV